jgi:hypothetical protein
MKLNRTIVAGILAGLLALGAVACETENGEDPLTDDTATETEITPTPTDT